MSDRMTSEALARMARCAAEQIRSHHALLSQLDSACGDGDHGTTMIRLIERVANKVEVAPETPLRTVFKDAGWQLLGGDGGASGALFGAFVLGMAADSPEADSEMGIQEVDTALEAGLRNCRRYTRAAPGDKTLLDALVPALAAFSSATGRGASLADAFREAALAAQAGAEATRRMTARAGRGRNLGNRTLGHQDPGATSVALLFRGFHQGFIGSERGTDHAGC
jgi:phosphoenolpyruvate---glycerone phosphotransferase subunit DhaL